ncbi:MAG: TonB-dependent receptor plug domain-containing protein, partial [Kordiimonadaceae bacterium]|nr:TonB-dependent receptor plug domain-containing protein [Kordiimonadaceae bacterium]
MRQEKEIPKYKVLLASILASSLSTSPWLAVYAATENGDNVDEVIISTASRSERVSSRESNTIATLTSDDLKLVGAFHISEVARRAPGVNISRNNGQEMLLSIRSPIFTGAGACGAFLMAQDGIALRSAGFCNVNALLEGFTENADRIELTSGPGSALYGSNALHGIINIVTPAADTDDNIATLEGGSYGYARFHASVGRTSGAHGLRLMGVLAHDGGYRDASGFDQQKIALR